MSIPAIPPLLQSLHTGTVCFSRFSSLRVSNGKQILSHWNALENYQIFPILAEKGGWWSLETHSKEKDLLSTKFPQLNLSQLNLSLKFHSHRGKTFISFCEKKKNVLMAF